MIAPVPYRPAAVLLMAALLAAAIARAQAPADVVVVLLSNGHVLEGTVRQEGGTITVSSGAGRVVQLPAGDVLCWAPDVQTLYRYRVDHRPGRGVDAHLADAQWCLREGLLAEAAAELQAAYRIHPRDPRLPAFERRLRHAASSQSNGADRSQVPSLGESAASDSTVSQPATGGGPVTTPSVTVAAGSDRTTDATPLAAVDASAAALQQQAVSKSLVGQFTARVQPLLINRCGQAGCHGGPSGAAWQLTHLGLAARLPARLTSENLQAALRWVDCERPETSPLLVRATTPHGDADDAPLGPGDADAIAELRRWITALAQRSESAEQYAGGPSPSAHGTPADTDAAAWPFDGARGGDTAAAAPADAQLAASEAGRGNASGATAAQRPMRLPPVADPFDPDVFNRMYHPQLAE